MTNPKDMHNQDLADTQFVYLACSCYEDKQTGVFRKKDAIFSSQVDAAMWLGDQSGDGFVHTFLIDEPEWDYSNIN